MFMGRAEDMDEWVFQVQVFSMCRSIFAWVPYMLLLFLLRFEILLDWIDEALIVLCLLMSVIDTLDYWVNANWRPVWMDWVVFGIISVSLVAYKLKRLKQ